MNLIADKNGVDVIISPVTQKDGFQVNLDFNFATQHLYDMDHRAREWNLRLMDGRRHVGTARFAAYQFIADGVERRTIALKFVSVETRYQGQKKSYDIVKFILDVVKSECDRDWGSIESDAVLFIEKKDMKDVPEKDRNAFFEFLKKIGEKVLGLESHSQPSGGDLSVSVIGDNISMQLIEGHLMRSNAAQTPKK